MSSRSSKRLWRGTI